MQVPAKIRNGNENTSHTECFLSPNFICREITSVFYPLPSVHPSVHRVCCTSVYSEQESCSETERRVLFITRTLSDVWIQMSTGWTSRLRPCRLQLCVKQHVECLRGWDCLAVWAANKAARFNSCYREYISWGRDGWFIFSWIVSQKKRILLCLMIKPTWSSESLLEGLYWPQSVCRGDEIWTFGFSLLHSRFSFFFFTWTFLWLAVKGGTFWMGR